MDTCRKAHTVMRNCESNGYVGYRQPVVSAVDTDTVVTVPEVPNPVVDTARRTSSIGLTYFRRRILILGKYIKYFMCESCLHCSVNNIKVQNVFLYDIKLYCWSFLMCPE